MATGKVVVVGAGIAGCAAASEAARLGLQVILVDEHPQSLEAMKLDAPFFYGARLADELGDQKVMSARVLQANASLAECAKVGVSTLTGTCVWGSFRPGENNTNLVSPQLGLADSEHSWLIDYDHLVLATGSRDLVLSFPGCELPGVLGANGMAALLGRYRALSGSRLVILGSGNLALRTAGLALEHGVQVVAIVEVGSMVRGSATVAASLRTKGVPFLLNHTVEQVRGESEVRAIRLVKTDAACQPVPGTGQDLPCDTVCMAFGAVPNVELAAVSGCRIEFNGALGGWAPVLADGTRTSLPAIHVIGDAGGIDDAMHLDPGIAASQGLQAARAIAGRDVRAVKDGLKEAPPPSTATTLVGAGAWLRSLVGIGGMDVVLCQCEDVTRREFLELSPPKYLRPSGAPTISGTSAAAPAPRNDLDLTKRVTRAGMGHCQGKRCRDQMALLLADATGTGIASISPGTYRMPVRPIPLNVFLATDESEEIRRSWPIWLHPVEEGAPGFASMRSNEVDHEKG